MNPTFLDDMSWEMAEVYGAITDQILINLARHFPFYDAGDPLPSSAFEYQAAMLAQMGQVNAETMRIIRNGLADADEALKNTLEQAIIDSVRKTSPELWKGVKKGVLMPPTMPVVSPNQYRAFQLYYTQAADKLNLVNTVMLESTKSAYAQTITDVVSDIELADRLNRTQIALDAAAGETITGVSSWNQALRHATDKLKNGGITGFVDHAGHHWSAEAYTAMDIRTTTFNTARSAVWETNQNFGNDLYIVSYHNGARPLCYPWQNKVISANNNAGVTYDLDGNEIEVIAQSATSYGEAAGLFGINCKHYPTPWIPGVSLADGKPQDKEDNDRVYAESQEQRRLERKLREEKRDLMMAKAQGRPQEEIDRLQAKCRKSSEDIDTFCKETGRARHRDREAVYTKREFPDKERYNVAEFERTQKEQIEQFYKNGGAQQNYTFGQMTPNEPIEKNVASEATQPPPPKYNIEGHTEKLKRTMSESEYKEFAKLANESETGKLYEKYGDSCADIKRVRNGGVYRGWDVVEYDFVNYNGQSKYSVVAHEMAHMFDAKIGEAPTLTFNEVNTINAKCTSGAWTIKPLRVRPSSSDEFLAAMRKDKVTLQEILKNGDELTKMRTGSWRNATGGVQDAMDGFFSTQDKHILPWGHGNKYYNRAYNRRFKDFGLEDSLAEAYDELGFGLKNKTAVKTQTRDYETAGELWANVLSAITCGGDELDAFKHYMPETVKVALQIIGGL